MQTQQIIKQVAHEIIGQDCSVWREFAQTRMNLDASELPESISELQGG
ncbi:MAG: hypothetical protein ACNA75_11125 [Thiohalomonadaceae bacterium]